MWRVFFFLTVLYVLCLPTAAFAAKTVNVDKSHSSKVRIPDDGLTLHVPEGVVAELSGAISGKGGLNKQGAGTLILTGKNTYTGKTVVEAGVLRISNQQALSDGTTKITVSGDGTPSSAVLESTDDLNLGRAGEFTLEVKDGGQVHTIPSKNIKLGLGAKTQINVSGKGSEIRSGGALNIGQSGHVDLNISSGAAVIAESELRLAGPDAVVVAYVAGDGARLEGASVYLGWHGQAEVHIAHKAKVISSSGDIYSGWGKNSKGVVLLDGTGVVLQSARSLYVGYDGQASMLVEGGAFVQTLDVTDDEQNIYMAYGPLSQSKVRVAGVESKLSSGGDLLVGYGGKAELDIQKKGQVFFSKTTVLGHAKDARGIVRLAGKGALLSDRVRRFDKNGIFQGFVKPLPPRLVEMPEEEHYDEAEHYDEYDSPPESDQLDPSPEYAHVAKSEAVENLQQSGDALVTIAERCIVAGFYGNGEIHVSHGARANAWGNIYAGYQEGAMGLIQASGRGSEVKADSNMHIGYMGHGKVIFSDGAIAESDELLNAENIYMAYSANSKARVDVSGASWLGARNEIIIGNLGQAELSLTTGGNAFINEGQIVAGQFDGSRADLTINGTGSKLFAGILYEDKEGHILFGSRGEAVVHVSAAGKIESCGSVVVGSMNKGVLTITGKDTELLPRGGLSIGQGGYGEVNVLDQALIQGNDAKGNFYIGENSGGEGVLNVDNASVFMSDSSLGYVGYYGKGAINISRGGLLDINSTFHMAYNDNSEGRLTASGGSIININSMTHLGYKGKGHTELKEGATLTSGYTFIGYEGGQATMLVDNSIFGCAKLSVGYQGQGRLDALNGAVLNIKTDIVFGESLAEARGLITIVNSKVNVGKDLRVGLSGERELHVLNGGKVQVANDIFITYFYGESNILVDGAGALLEGGRHLYVGLGTDGKLDIFNGGSVKVPRDVNVGGKRGGAGTVTINGAGSTLTCGQVVKTVDGGQATVSVQEGGKIIIVERDQEADAKQDMREKSFFLFGE